MTNNNPLFTSLSNAVNYCQNTPVLHASVEMLSDLVAHHSYTGHPDDECVYENSMRGDLECFYYTCTEIQEAYETLVTRKLETPTDHPAYESIVEKMIEMGSKYGGDIDASEY